MCGFEYFFTFCFNFVQLETNKSKAQLKREPTKPGLEPVYCERERRRDRESTREKIKSKDRELRSRISHTEIVEGRF